ncbi:hypothetical protein JOD54_001490 [Actinokineospora baliensis]|uniref:hypothetical protein n=1 Tax=Actinokineospora baliensis TaxID=547056 RepID=UPI001959FE86|nr:hypothetical protein [Actinokineospora baliensis]MBM7771286.1 hypothetical protein [Actinokineospora baliensis]
MERGYPVVVEQELRPVQAKSFLKRKPVGRAWGEVPRPKANEQLVYRSAGTFFLDTQDLPLDSGRVVNASRVSVVDMTGNAEVVLTLAVPARDAASFTVRVTFLCTVTDAVAVVREGVVDASAALTSYLKGHHGLYELGLDFTLDDINLVRRKVNAQVRAYWTVVPAEIMGLAVELASVEVLTPEELAGYENTKRVEQQQHLIELARLGNEQALIDQRTQFEQSREVVRTHHSSDLSAARREQQRAEKEHAVEVAGGDAVSALQLAYALGEITAKELGAELSTIHERERQDRAAELEQDRADLRERIAHDRELAKMRADTERADREQEAQWQRRRAEQEFDARIRIIETVAKQGHIDAVNLQLDQVVKALVGPGSGAPRQAIAEQPEDEVIDPPAREDDAR